MQLIEHFDTGNCSLALLKKQMQKYSLKCKNKTIGPKSHKYNLQCVFKTRYKYKFHKEATSKTTYQKVDVLINLNSVQSKEVQNMHNERPYP